MTETLKLPTTVAARPRGGALNSADVALYSSLAGHSRSAQAELHQHRALEASGQLAAWEDEGGATACTK
jgi:hypothetical protein